jgi:hypothetical protein
VDADQIAQHVIAAAPESGSVRELFERVFGRRGDAAMAAALAFWGLTLAGGTPATADVRAVEESLLAALGVEDGDLRLETRKAV